MGLDLSLRVDGIEVKLPYLHSKSIKKIMTWDNIFYTDVAFEDGIKAAKRIADFIEKDELGIYESHQDIVHNLRQWISEKRMFTVSVF